MKTTVLALALSSALFGADAAPRKSRCPPGYRRVDHKSCLSETKKDPNADCPAGFDLVGDSVKNYKCRRIVKSPIDPMCKVGFELSADGKTCTKSIEKQGSFFCKENGFTLSNDQTTCEKKINEPAQPVCEDLGAKLTQENKCRTIVEDNVSFKCQGEGFSLTKSKKECRKVVNEAAEPFCEDDDFFFNGDRCVNKIVKPLRFKCEGDGFTLTKDEKNCKKVLKEDAERFCQNPDAELKNQKCIFTEQRDAKFKCADGFEPVGGQGAAACKKIETKEPELKCSEGTLVQDGQCRIPEFRDPIIFCEAAGLTLSENGKYCLGTDETAADKVCNGDIEQDGKCFDEKKLDKVFQCQKGWELTDLLGKDDIPMCKSACNKKKCLYQVAHLVCPKNSIENDKGQCIELIPVDFDFVCQEGKLDGRKCIINIKEESSIRCSREFDLIEGPRCRRFRFVPAELICKPSDSYSLNTMTKLCEKTIIRDIIPFCQDDFKLSDKKTKCLKVTITQSKLRCTVGGFNLLKRQCVKTIIKPSISFCKLEQFEEMNGECAKNVSKPPSFRCPSQDQELKGRRCVSFKVKDSIRFCKKDGFSLNDSEDLCLKIVLSPPSFSCENVGSGNLMLDGKRCVKIITKESDFECIGDGFTRIFDSSVCEKIISSDSRAVCPIPGTKLSGDKTFCFLFKFANVEFSCEDGLRLILKKGPICFRRDIKSPIYFD